MPLGKVLGIAEMLGRVHVMPLPPFVFRALPFVEGFVHHQQAQFVAKVQQVRIGRIMGRAQSVAARRLEFAQPPFPHVFRHRRAQAARVVMHAHAPQLHIFPVQEKARVRVKAEHAEAGFQKRRVHHIAVLQRLSFQHVQGGAVRAPQPGIVHGQLRISFFPRPLAAGCALPVRGPQDEGCAVRA